MLKKIHTALAAFIFAGSLFADGDHVRTRDGARLTGTILKIDEGVIHMETPYAGEITIDQEQVTSLQTENPRFIRFRDGTILSGSIQAAENGKVRVRPDNEGAREADLDRITASWRPSDEDPVLARERAERERLARSWSYRFGADLLGKTGNSEELSIGLNLEATLASPDDELDFFIDYEQREQDGETSADQLVGGASYEAFFSEIFGWFLRNQLETDAIAEIDFRSTTGAGISYRLINKEQQRLVLRSGLGHRFTSYDTDRDTDSEATLDFGLKHRYQFNELISMNNELSLVQPIGDFNNFEFMHETNLEIPVASSKNWKLNMGVKNEFENDPAADRKLDTTYFTRMVYEWE